jgi:hypothetical protein
MPDMIEVKTHKKIAVFGQGSGLPRTARRKKMRYDFIADVHGYADHLEAVLKKLGYRNRNGAYRHSDPDRIAVSVGDLMDRGPRQFDSLDIFRRMRDAGTGLAVMGNHEHAAIGWYQENPVDPGHYLRSHSDKNRKQHQVFLDSVAGKPGLHRELVEWMMTMPLFFSTEGFRVTHACWDPKSISVLAPFCTPDGALTREALFATYDKHSAIHEASEVTLRGPEVDLPEGINYKDAGGVTRTTSRLRWWDETLATFRSGAITDELCFESVPETPLPEESIIRDSDPRPIIFGHYWLPGEPVLLSGKRACLDFSVAAGGPLVAYQWDGESVLTPDNLVAVSDHDFACQPRAFSFA